MRIFSRPAITEDMQKCIDFIKDNETEIAEYVNSIFSLGKTISGTAFISNMTLQEVLDTQKG